MASDFIPDAWAALMDPAAVRTAVDCWERANLCRTDGENVLPPQAQVFRALHLTHPDALRCVIVGQDPYHTPGVANGLAFSANPGCRVPPSLRNIFRELSADIGCAAPSEPDLTPWAQQGVLLLNAILTVRAGAAGSHAAWGWQSVTRDILRVCMGRPQPVMFLLWGRHALDTAKEAGILPGHQEMAWNIGNQENTQIAGVPPLRKAVYCSTHPSPLGASRAAKNLPAFLGSRPFSRTNAFLRTCGAREIEWRLP